MAIFTDLTRDLIWNVPSDKGGTAKRFIIPTGNWSQHRLGIVVSGSDGTKCLIPFVEVAYFDREMVAFDSFEIGTHYRCPRCKMFTVKNGDCSRCGSVLDNPISVET